MLRESSHIPSPAAPPKNIRLSDVVSALSAALDLTEGQPMGHAMRSCVIGMRLAEEIHLPTESCSDLYYALLLKDAGCSANSARLHCLIGGDDIQAKREVKVQDWTRRSFSGLRYLLRNVLPHAPMAERVSRIAKLSIDFDQNNRDLVNSRCVRGAEIARKIGLTVAAADSIHSLDEHWDGRGYPQGLKGEKISLLARIMNLSQTLEVFNAKAGPRIAVNVVCERSKSWFDPHLVQVVKKLGDDESLWRRVSDPEVRKIVMQMEPGMAIPANEKQIENICLAFAEVIDTKSPYTFQHSVKVAEAATGIAKKLGLPEDMVTTVRRAALLHDIGKLSVSNAILEKPSELTILEWDAIRMSPIYTRVILENIYGFREIAFYASAHNERLDGSGYPERLAKSEIPLPSRIIGVADVFQAMCEKRSYREPWAAEIVLDMMKNFVPNQLDKDCYDALRQHYFEKATPKHLVQAAGKSGSGAICK